MANTKQYTTNKIYFRILKKPEEFKKKYDTYFNNLDNVYSVGTFRYNDYDFYNIQLDFNNGKMSQNEFDQFMNDFKNVCDDGFKNAYYKYSSNGDECKYSYIIN
jgi:hypothetical protein